MTRHSPRDCSDFFLQRYNAEGFDCVDLTLAVQRKLHGRGFSVPSDRTLARRAMRELFRTYLIETETPQDGDVVLMREAGRHKADHVGTWYRVGTEPCVLHTTERTDTIYTRVRLLRDLGLTIEGIYTWQS